MPRIASLVPLPGIPELENVARYFSNRLRDADLEHGTRATLERRLKYLIEGAKKLQDHAEITSQLLDIQTQFQAADIPNSRIGIRHAQRKLELWEELNSRLNETMEENMFDLIVQTRQAQFQQENTRSPELKVQTVESYKIASQAEIYRQDILSSITAPSLRRLEKVKTTMRKGQYGGLSVSYMTFVADSKDVAHELVKREAEYISQSLHINIAPLVGVTKGYNGLNGIVVVTGGIDLKDFASIPHSGAVWAKCIRGFESVTRMTVTPDGHLTVFPVASKAGLFGGISSSFGDAVSSGDQATGLLLGIYINNRSLLGPAHMRPFIDSLTELGVAFTELQVLKLAASFRLFPFREYHKFGHSTGRQMVSSQTKLGYFGWIIRCNTRPTDWRSLEISRCLQDMSLFPGSTYWCESTARNGDRWLTYILSATSLKGDQDKSSRGGWEYVQRLSERFLWGDVFAEAQEISQRRNIDLDSIALCYYISCNATVLRPKSANWNEIPKTLYYHWSPQASDPQDAEGFLSASVTPDSGLWQKSLRKRGWGLYFRLRFWTYNMRDDWGRQYERVLLRSMSAMPGSYPLAHIEENLD